MVNSCHYYFFTYNTIIFSASILNNVKGIIVFGISNIFILMYFRVFKNLNPIHHDFYSL